MSIKGKLAFAPGSEFDRVLALEADANVRTALFADLCRINALYMISFAGSGHAGSSLSSLDIVSYLYLQRMRGAGQDTGDVYFSSKGHDAPGIYAALIGLGLLPFGKIHELRKLGGLPGHPDIETPCVAANTGSLGMGISKARGMALADALNGVKRRYYVLLGDGELQEGQIWESLLPTANRGVSSITAIIDHNKLQSDTYVSIVSDLGDIESRARSFGWAVARCGGHDISSIGAALDRLDEHEDRPKLLIADTIKGKGAGRMESTAFKPEDRLYKFHSGAPAAEYYEPAVEGLADSVNRRLAGLGERPIKLEIVDRPRRETPQNPQKLVESYSNALVAQAAVKKNLVALSADLALDTGLIPFEREYPDRFFECGIAEQDMVSQAGGMALRGLYPVVHSFACFLSTRPNEQIFNNATERTRILYAGSLAGLLPAGPGHSHQSIRDIAALSAVPGLEMIEPSCGREVDMAVDYCVNRAGGPVYLRLVSIPVATAFSLPEGYTLRHGRGVALSDGGDAVVFGYGPVMLSEAVAAARDLASEGIMIRVVNLPWLNRVDDEWLGQTVAGYKVILTLDNHYIEGGQGEFLRSRLALFGLGRDVRVDSIGVDGGIALCGRNDEVLKAHGMDSGSIKTRVKKLLQ